MFFSTNIKLLRKRKRKTQDDVAFALEMKRSTLNNYENNISQPSIEALLAFSGYYKICIDTLIKIDLTELSEHQLTQLEKGYDVFITGSKLRVLATTVDSSNEENIEMISEKAKAGYRTGFADPEYIASLPKFQIPTLPKSRKYRAFQLSGDSMNPIPHGSWVIAEFVTDWTLLKRMQACVVLTLNDGIVFKLVENKLSDDGTYMLHSLNPEYQPYPVHVNDVKEIWKFVSFMSMELPSGDLSQADIAKTLAILKNDINQLKSSQNMQA